MRSDRTTALRPVRTATEPFADRRFVAVVAVVVILALVVPGDAVLS